MARLDHIQDLRIFEAIGRAGSLSEAARTLGLSLTHISKRLKQLESVLGIRLVQRTTRQLTLTPEGQDFLIRCRDVLHSVELAEDVGPSGTGQGIVRITAASAFAQRQIAPRLPAFLEGNPGITVQVLATNSVVDLIEHRIDFAVRQVPLDDSSLIKRRLVRDAWVLVASPAYLAKAGGPRSPADLGGHACLAVGDPPPRVWTLCAADRAIDVRISSPISGADGEIAHAAALADGGIAMKAAWDVITDIRAGRLVRVLPEWWGGIDRWIHLVYPARSHQPRRVQAMIAFLEAELHRSFNDNIDLALFENRGMPFRVG